jgi:soluble lytic murein transglycosylase-like protein/predicted negative regulator of RcsB-dependent stress response
VTRKRGLPFGLALFFIAVAFAQSAFPQSVGEQSKAIHAQVESGNLSDAVTSLRALKKTNSSVFTLNNFDYLLGRLLERKGDRSGASSNYKSVLARQSVLSEYAVWHLAQLARRTGDLVHERERLRQLISLAPTSLLRETASIRLAESYFDSKDYLSVASTLRPLTESKKVTLARQALMLTGQAYVKAGRTNEARDVFIKLVSTVPDSTRPDDFALAAARGLDALDKSVAVSESEHWQRAFIYQFNRDFDGARAHYLALVSQFPQSSNVPEALYQLGRGFYQQERYDEAIKYLQQVESQYNSSASARDALALTAGAYVRLKRTNDAVATYQQQIQRYPNAPNPERAYLNLIDALRDAGRYEEALSWVAQTRAQFKDQLPSTLALFSQAKIHLAANSWTEALADLDELLKAKDAGGLRVAGGTTTSELTFLRGFVREQLQQFESAIDDYLSIPEGRNEYFGFRAQQRISAVSSKLGPNLAVSRLGKMMAVGAPQSLLESGQFDEAVRAARFQLRGEKDPTRRKELLDIIRQAYAALPAYKFPAFQLISLGRTELITVAPPSPPAPTHQELGSELFFLALYDEAVPEIAAARSEKATATAAEKTAQPSLATVSPDQAYSEAVYFLRGGIPYPAVRFAEQTWRTVPGDFVLELAPRQITEMLYPAAYRNSAVKYSQARQLDPRFVLSIARQETRFQADAKSVAAARGLMQFIAATAEQTAKRLGRRDFDQDDLYNADTALQFGTQYLSDLFQQFPQQPEAVAAAYNGGPDNIARWMARSGSQDPNRFVPEIGFAQTKDYVFRVMSNYWVYQQLYDENLDSLW